MEDFYLMYMMKTPFLWVHFKQQHKKRRNAKSDKMVIFHSLKKLANREGFECGGKQRSFGNVSLMFVDFQ